MNVEQTIRDYIAEVLHLSLATSADNKPWVCELHFAYDNNLNLYFRTKVDTRHGREIAANPFVAGNIVGQHGPTNKPRAVYFEGVAELLEDATEQAAYDERFGKRKGILLPASQPNGHKYFRVVVSDYYLFDTRESSPPQKYHLPMIAT